MTIRSALALLLFSATVAEAEEGVRRTVEDAGVHIPVLTKAPVLTGFVEATYPPEAEAQGLTAEVAMQITIGADGHVADAQVTRPAGHGFDEAALAAVKQFVFTPAEIDDVPATVQVEYVYHFVLRVVDAGVPEVDAGPPPKPHAILKGTLISRGSRTRIVGGLVICVNQPGPEALSDEQGQFSLELEAGDCQVRVVSADHKNFDTTETLEANETRVVNYYVLPKVVGYETVVRGERERKEVVDRTVSRQEVQKIPGTFGDPVRVIQNFPGVARAPLISGALVIRGASANESLTFFDGVEIPILFHLGGGPSVVNAEFLDKVDFFPGGFGARYGRAIGGVIDVSSRKGAADTYHGSAKVDFLDSAIFFEAPLTPNVSIAAAARRSYIDVLLPPILEAAQRSTPGAAFINAVPVYWDYQLRIDAGAKRGHADENGSSTFSLFVFGSDDTLKVVASGGARSLNVSLDTHTTFHRLVGNWTWREGAVTYRLTPYLGYDLVSLNLANFVTLSADQWSQGLRQDLTVDATPWLAFHVGTDLYNHSVSGQAELPVIDGTQYVGFPGADPKTPQQTIREDLDTFDGAIFGEMDIKVGPLTVTPGVRATHTFVTRQTRHSVDPRLWVKYQLLESTAIKGSVGLYTQTPSPIDFEPTPFGNPNLGTEKAFQTSLGVSHRFSPVLNVDLTGFYNRRFDLAVVPGATVVNPDGTVTDELYGNLGLGRAYGFELLARHEVTKNFFGWIAYTLSRSEARRSGTTNPYVLSGTDQTHILTVIGSYRFDNGWELGGRYRYVTGNPTTPLLTGAPDLYNADSNGYSSTTGDPRSARLPAFNQLDLRVDKYFVYEKWTLDLYLDVQNVLNTPNVETTIDDYRHRQRLYVTGIPILPVLGVKASF